MKVKRSVAIWILKSAYRQFVNCIASDSSHSTDDNATDLWKKKIKTNIIKISKISCHHCVSRFLYLQDIYKRNFIVATLPVIRIPRPLGTFSMAWRPPLRHRDQWPNAPQCKRSRLVDSWHRSPGRIARFWLKNRKNPKLLHNFWK